MEELYSDETSNDNWSLSTQENVACVKARLLEEGREARNLIAYSLPLQSRKNYSALNQEKPSKAPQPKENKKLSVDGGRVKREKRHRSASAGRDPQASLRARHWGFLFRNLQQAVDEIYQTSEDDESIIECKEAILMLERYTNDFYKLIEWLKIKWEYENTSLPQRPTSLTWEIRTSSPAKNFRSDRRFLSLSEVRKALNFEQVDHPPTGSTNAKGEVGVKEPKQHAGKQERGVVDPPKIIVEEIKSEDKPSSRSVEEAHPLQASTISEHSKKERLPPDRTLSKMRVEKAPFSNSQSDPALKRIENSRRCGTSLLGSIAETLTSEAVALNDEAKAVESGVSSLNTKQPFEVASNDEAKAVESGVSSLNTKQPHSSPASRNDKDSTAGKDPLASLITSVDVQNDKPVTSSLVLYAAKLKDPEKHATEHTVDTKKPLPNGIIKDHKKDLDCKIIKDDKKEVTITIIKKDDPNANIKNGNSSIIKDDKKEANNSISSKKEIGTITKDVVQQPTKDDVKIYSEPPKSPETNPSKNVHSKPGPLVNMNKASEVRRAFNQSRTPVKAQQPASWKNTSLAPSDNKSNCIKQQGAGGRMTVRRLTDGKPTQSPPLGRRSADNKGWQRGGAGSIPRAHLERSATSYPMTRPAMVRSSTTLESAPDWKQFSGEQELQISGDRCPSNASLASSSNTSSSGQSWADKVRGGSTPGPTDSESRASLPDADEEGWEVVRRNRRSHGGSVTSLNSQGGPISKTYHPNLQKRGSAPFRVQRRFHQPSSAVSLPSLSAVSSDKSALHNSPMSTKEMPNALKRAPEPIPKPKSNGSGGPTETKRNGDKRKVSKGNYKENFASNKGTNVNEDTSKHIQDPGLTPKTSECDKYRKNVANTKTQNESKFNNANNKFNNDSSSKVVSNNTSPVSKEATQKDALKSKLKEPNHESALDEGKDQELSNARVDGGTEPEPFSHRVPQLNVELKKERDDSPQRDSDDESDRESEEIRCNAEAFETVLKEEQKLKQEIEETERASIEDCDVIDEEGEGDANAEGEENQTRGEGAQRPSPDVKESFYQYDPAFSKLTSLTWAEEMDAIEDMEAVRPPGRVLHIHEKLSSPSRKLPISEKLRRHKEKLAKAQELRGKLIHAKTEKLKDLFRKIDDVNIDKERLLLEKRGLFERKMERAEEKRRSHLQEIVNKAHDEENKAKEIAFINGLEAQNKLHDIMQQHQMCLQSHESRLADMAEERCRKQEEKAAKEAAAQERRKALEAERQARMLELCEKRRKRCERIDRQQAERREELLEQAREKARDREERLSALQQAQQAKESELVKKIQQKQEETARRHEENIEQIRQKALESSIMKYSRGSDEAPKLRRYETSRMCTLCSSVITSEVYLLSHLRSRGHQDALKELHKRDVSQEESETYNLKFIINAPANIDDPQAMRDKERQKGLKKRCRKIRARMASRGKEYLKEFSLPTVKEVHCKGRVAKALNGIKKVVGNQGSGPWPTSDVTLLDRYLLELLRILEKEKAEAQKVFASLDGFRTLATILDLILNEESGGCVVPPRSLAFCGRVLVAACKEAPDNCRFILHSNLVGAIVEQLLRRLRDLAAEAARSGSSNSLNTVSVLPADPAAAALMELLAQILSETEIRSSSDPDKESDHTENNWFWMKDVVSYCVSVGVADKISWYFSQVQNPVENDPPSAEIIMAAMSLLSVFAAKLSDRRTPHPEDPTQLIATFHVLDACGVVSLLYGLLLHQGGRSPSPPAVSLLSPSTLAICAAATTFLHKLALLDLNMFQAILGSEGISLEFRHIASFLLWYCSHWPCEEVLHNVIHLVGFFAANNKENQSIIQSGETPSVLQQLCSLPWPYFSEPRLTNVLFPTLLACCLNNDDNVNILQQEMTFQVLEDFLEANKSSRNPLLSILKRTPIEV